MVAVGLKLLFSVSALHSHTNPNPIASKCDHRPSPQSISLNSPRSRTPTIKSLETQSNAPPISPFCLILPYLRSVGGLVAARARRLRSCLRGGLDNGNSIYGHDVVCNGGIATVLMSTTAASTARVSPYLWTLAGNPTFVSGLVAWALAQTMKMFLNFFVERRWDLAMLFTSGGMPSSHSALCTALTTSVALCHGVADSLFPVCLWFSLIVMYDAIGVRRHAGMQAEVLNKIVEDLFQGHPISQRKLKELLGHTPSQVIAGAFLGILVACFCCQGCVVAI